MNLREAAQQALDELIAADGMPICNETDILDLSKTIEILRAALADTQEWDEVEAMRASLREQLAEINRLRAAGRQALDAFDSMYGRKPERVEEVITTLRATLSWDAMQRLTDVHQEIEQPVKERHDKEGDNLSPPLDHVPDATKMMAMRMPKEGDRVICIEDESVGTVQWTSAAGGPYIKFEDGSRGQWSLREFGVLFRYADAPPKRKPMTIGQLFDLYNEHAKCQEEDWLVSGWLAFAAAIERAHGIGGEE